MTDTASVENSPLPLYRAIHKVMEQVGRLKNDERNSSQNYNFASVHAVYDYIRPLMVDAGLIIIPAMIGYTESQYETRRGGIMHRATVTFEFTVACIETSFTLKEKFTVHGDDSGDKAFTKAASFADKYFLLKLFKISTGDEVEADKVSHEAKRPTHWHDNKNHRAMFVGKLREKLNASDEASDKQVLDDALKLVNQDDWYGYTRGLTALRAVEAVYKAQQVVQEKEKIDDWLDEVGGDDESDEAGAA